MICINTYNVHVFSLSVCGCDFKMPMYTLWTISSIQFNSMFNKCGIRNSFEVAKWIFYGLLWIKYLCQIVQFMIPENDTQHIQSYSIQRIFFRKNLINLIRWNFVCNLTIWNWNHKHQKYHLIYRLLTHTFDSVATNAVLIFIRNFYLIHSCFKEKKSVEFFFNSSYSMDFCIWYASLQIRNWNLIKSVERLH